jgi:hypothetical protein
MHIDIRLQIQQQDLSSAFSFVKEIIKIFKAKRKISDEGFSNYFINVTKVASKIGEEIKIPKMCGRQTKRNNIKTSNLGVV